MRALITTALFILVSACSGGGSNTETVDPGYDYDVIRAAAGGALHGYFWIGDAREVLPETLIDQLPADLGIGYTVRHGNLNYYVFVPEESSVLVLDEGGNLIAPLPFNMPVAVVDLMTLERADQIGVVPLGLLCDNDYSEIEIDLQGWTGGALVRLNPDTYLAIQR